ncbi:MAG: hypothetical protein JNN15_11310 [Blastocatellia bacterium]|nr:hypothetical protein [Blastocatellia bacterium]
MTIINVLLGLAIIFIILVEAFETIILPRRVKRKVRLTRLFYQSLWFIWSKFAKGALSPKSRESFLSVFGPFSLIGLLSVWAICLITGFALLQYGLQSPLNCPEK